MVELPEKQKKLPIRLFALLGGSLLILALVVLVDFEPDMSGVDVRVGSGPKAGNYNALMEKISVEATAQGGRIENFETEGSVDNLERLNNGCQLQFALVQDGIAGSPDGKLELIARLPKSESVFIIGRDAAKIQRFSDMRGMRMGIGPLQGGSNHLARLIFENETYQPLGLQLMNMDVEKQVAELLAGNLDLGVFVLDEDAKLIKNAIGKQGLELVSLKNLDVLARQFSFLWDGRIGAGQYDPIALLPPSDKRVLRVDTLVVSNGCASRSETIALLSLLREQFPLLLKHNREHAGSVFFPTAKMSKLYITNNGPEWTDIHVPWLVNIMPLDNWFYVVMGISMLFNVMTFGHRFRLWRIDATRSKTLELFREVLGDQITPAEIYEISLDAKKCQESSLAVLTQGMQVLNKLRIRCQNQENSMLVPMGQEWAYRFQEEQIELILTAVRDFKERADIYNQNVDE